MKIWLASGVLALLSGCAAMGVPATSDPNKKIASAIDLYDHQGRPLPVEPLLQEAIEICTKRDDFMCLGRANIAYGFFFVSPIVRQWEGFYRKNGFRDESVTFDSRFVKAQERFETGIQHYKKIAAYDRLANAYLNLGHVHHLLKDNDSQCQAYVESIKYHQKNIAENSEADVQLPGGVASFEEHVKKFQKNYQCVG